jgi:hypothetical protein
MKTVLDFIKLWAGKIFAFTKKKNFIYFFSIITFLLCFIIETSLIALIGVIGSVVTLVANVLDEKTTEPV